eukprot:GEMP01170814.1.p1 GENE.GEMP01170814.1~~GEMP01170814.1.p1  ORF type:complete len:103 (+),score=1.24 GEMP01170814.1:2-310(+)
MYACMPVCLYLSAFSLCPPQTDAHIFAVVIKIVSHTTTIHSVANHHCIDPFSLCPQAVAHIAAVVIKMVSQRTTIHSDANRHCIDPFVFNARHRQMLTSLRW